MVFLIVAFARFSAVMRILQQYDQRHLKTKVVTINMSIHISNTCIQCGACVRDCPRSALNLDGSSVSIRHEICNQCGHCIAICPKNAVSNDEYPAEDIQELSSVTCGVDPDDLLKLFIARRSIRQFTGQTVEPEKIHRIVESGRFAPTACNFQTTRFIVVQEKYQKLRAILLNQLNTDGQEILKSSNDVVLLNRASGWINQWKAYQEDPLAKDTIFYDAPCVVIIVSPDVRDGAIAAAYMEIMAAAEGLGALYNGNMSAAINNSLEARDLLGVKAYESANICMLFGYPAVKYQRTVPRQPANITLL
jgi:nitroreductase/Pyruvate/2-oxoacid:ferredoxin oxidoreductase delta subunit